MQILLNVHPELSLFSVLEPTFAMPACCNTLVRLPVTLSFVVSQPGCLAFGVLLLMVPAAHCSGQHGTVHCAPATAAAGRRLPWQQCS